MPDMLPRGVDARIEWSARQVDHPSQDWHNLCQSHVRQAMGVGAWASSAKAAWNRIPAGHRYRDPFDRIPRGAAIYFGMGTYGHVMLATRSAALSNDYDRSGRIDYVPRDIPGWGGPSHYLGWSDWTPFGLARLGSHGAWDGQVPGRENVRDGNPGARFRLQARLFDLGYRADPPDDGPDPAYPHDALQRFQQVRGLTVSGDYNARTQAELFGGEDRP